MITCRCPQSPVSYLRTFHNSEIQKLQLRPSFSNKTGNRRSDSEFLNGFFIINLPEGDYVTAYIAQLQATGSMVDAEEADNLRKFYGLDNKVFVPFKNFQKSFSR